MKSSHKAIIVFLMLLAVDAIIAAGVAEGWIRMFIPVANICYYHDPTLGDMFCPKQRTYGYAEQGYANLFINNSRGFHDIERRIEKPKNKKRIHVYGDSMIAGAGVPINKTIPSLLEFYLNRTQEPTTEVANMASAEDSTGSEYLIYQHIGKLFSPDVVIVYFMNDFHDNIFETHPRTRSPFFQIDDTGQLIFIPPTPVNTSTPWERFKRWSQLYRLMANKFLSSQLYADITRQIRALRFSKPSKKQSKGDTKKKATALEKRYQVLKEKAWPVTVALLKQFRKEVERQGAQFILVDGFPITPTSAGGYVNTDLEDFCKKNSITYIPMYKEYAALKKSRDYSTYFLKDSHPTIVGNETLTKILSQKLQPVLNKTNVTPYSK